MNTAEARRRIIFVDEEANVLQGLRRLLHRLADSWDMRFVQESSEATRLMAETPFDVIVTDITMPGADGGNLLDDVMKRHPQVVRIALSAYSDRERILPLISATHQFLAKPCDPDQLRGAIARACALRDLLKEAPLRQLVGTLNALPSVPALYDRVMAAIRRRDVAVAEVGKIIAEDMGMSSKVLQLVNSAFFGLPRKVTDPAVAVMLLGIENLKALVLSAGIFNSYRGGERESAFLEQLQRHALETGAMARAIALREKTERDLTNEAFMAGVMHDVGKLVLMARMPDELFAAHAKGVSDNIPPHKTERAALGVSHAEVGAYLLGLWGLPDAVAEAAAFHHRPGYCVFQEFSALTAVHVANAFTHDDHDKLLDREYLEKIGCGERLGEWREACAEITAAKTSASAQ